MDVAPKVAAARKCGRIADASRVAQWNRACEIGGGVERAIRRLSKKISALDKLASDGGSMAVRQLAFIACEATKALTLHIARCKAENASWLLAAIGELAHKAEEWPILVSRRVLQSETRREKWVEKALKYFKKIQLGAELPQQGALSKGSKLQLPDLDELDSLQENAPVPELPGKGGREVSLEKLTNAKVIEWLNAFDRARRYFVLEREKAVQTRRRRRRLTAKQKKEMPLGGHDKNTLLTSNPKKWAIQFWNVPDSEAPIYEKAVCLPPFNASSALHWWEQVFKPFAELHSTELPIHDQFRAKSGGVLNKPFFRRLKGIVVALAGHKSP